MGYSISARFAVDFLDISPQRWHHFERGQPLSGAVTDMLVRKIPGMTSDWLKYGNPDGLSVQLYRQLEGDLPAPGKTTKRG